MSGFDGKAKGTDTGVTAAQMVGQGPTFTPGKTNAVQTYDTGVAYIDKGTHCADGDAAGCFLDGGQRQRLTQLLLAEIGVAQTNYKFAIEELRVDKLIEKDDDLNWVISLVLDLATSHISTVAGKALSKLKGQAIKDAAGFGLGDLDLDDKGGVVTNALKKVSDKAVETTAKTGFDMAKKKVAGKVKAAQNAQVKEDRADTLSYLDLLKERCDVGFQDFERQVLARASDAEMIVVFQGMDAQYHTIGHYKAALADKLARYKKSGVPEIGQKTVDAGEAHVAPKFASKRCVWLRNADGSKTLWTYHVVGSNQTDPWANGDPDIEKVPDEFVDAAIVRSEEKWGATPTFTNPAVSIMEGLRKPAPAPAPKQPPGPNGLPFLQLGKPWTGSTS